jgi:hypothetical protein
MLSESVPIAHSQWRFACSVDGMRRNEECSTAMSVGPPNLAEHQRYERLPLRLPLQFARDGRPQLVECVTEDISGDEVCFVSPELLLPDERVEVDILLAARNTSCNAPEVHLVCVAQVLRIDPTRSEPNFRIGCRIKNYTIRFGSGDLQREPVL